MLLIAAIFASRSGPEESGTWFCWSFGIFIFYYSVYAGVQRGEGHEAEREREREMS